MTSQDKYAIALPKAISWTAGLMVNKFDRAGQPYIMHSLFVMNGVLHLGYDHAILGICHDNIEDFFKGREEEGFDEFRRLVMDERSIVDDLDRLTHYEHHTYKQYIMRVAESERSKEVKKVDFKHNSDITRLKGLTEKDIARIRKYHTYYTFLNGDTEKLLGLLGE